MSATAPIDFWFDFASPYGYFMSERIDALAARHGRPVRWRPVLLFAVLRVLALPAPLGHDLKRAYMTHDFERSARFLGIPYRMPEGFPAVTQHAARAFYLLERVDPEAARAFAQAAMRGYFRDGAALGDPRHVAALAHAADPTIGTLDALMALLQGAEAKSMLSAAVDEAVRQRIFGSPMVVIDGEAFFGVDRLPQIEAWLAGTLTPSQGANA
jgi:2-hydroxychromene-2-carboxylate isomerase